MSNGNAEQPGEGAGAGFPGNPRVPPSLPQAPPASPRSSAGTAGAAGHHPALCSPRCHPQPPVPPGSGSCGRHGDGDAEPPPRILRREMPGGAPTPGTPRTPAGSTPSPSAATHRPSALRCRPPPGSGRGDAGGPRHHGNPGPGGRRCPQPLRLPRRGAARLGSAPPASHRLRGRCPSAASAARLRCARPGIRPPPARARSPLRAGPAPGRAPRAAPRPPPRRPRSRVNPSRPGRRQRGSAPPPLLTCAPLSRRARPSRCRERLRAGTKPRSGRGSLAAPRCASGPGTAVPQRAPQLPPQLSHLGGVQGAERGCRVCPRLWPPAHPSAPVLPAGATPELCIPQFPHLWKGWQPGSLPRPGHFQHS
ncbi:basic salivary proline-rich protein 2-like [Haemorhous mexicanus]|uniref:basic salivary proline-rich protein 2-like n=1 Tax=Haemorhous mexicanus TaxID=30427 RepID=UPI0028BD1A81|nr:basic salivary proline-rich protein 2-like [Haemorhous mexicanus]